TRLLALLHRDLHPPPLLGALGALAGAQLTLGGSRAPPSAPQIANVLVRRRRGGVREQDEIFSLPPDGSSVRSLGSPPPLQGISGGGPQISGGPPPPHQPLTFRLRLSAAEWAARAAVTPPYQLRPPR
ncbi:ELP5 protein, partial [Syrrhaptes paradoxus]|nr:ELP5 protein [Syrrhaptes paradoxus]